MRNIRRKAKDELDKLVKDGEVGEDDVTPRREGARRADARSTSTQSTSCSSTRRPSCSRSEDRQVQTASRPGRSRGRCPSRARTGADRGRHRASRCRPRPARRASAARAATCLRPSVVGSSLGLIVLGLLLQGGVVLAARRLVVGAWELTARCGERRGTRSAAVRPARRRGRPIVLAGLRRRHASALVVALALTVLAVLVWRIAGGADGLCRATCPRRLLTSIYLPFLVGFAALMLAPEDGAARMFVVHHRWSSAATSAATPLGVLFGKHPMAPTHQPEEVLGGFAGSVLACIVGGALMVCLLLDGAVVAWRRRSASALACSATVGDLVESLIKRDLGIKDMGTLLPGHGGIMDRLDSLLAVAPVVWAVLTLFAPPT